MANETPSILITAQLNKSVSINNITADLKEIEKQLPNLNLKYNIDTNSVNSAQQTTTKITKSTQDLSAQLGNLQNRAQGAYGGFLKYLQQNSQAAEKLPSQISVIKDQFTQLQTSTDFGTAKQQMQKFTASISAFKGEVREAGIEGKTFGQTIANDIGKLGQWLSATTVLIGAFHEIKEGISSVISMNTSLTQTAEAMGTSVSNLGELATSAQSIAKTMGASISDVLDIAHIYSNEQTSLTETIEHTKSAVELMNISGLSSSESSDALQGVQQAFGITADKLEHVNDVMATLASNVKINYQTAIQDMSQAISTAGTAAHEAGMSLEQYLAVTIKAAETTRQTGDTISTAEKTIFARVGQSKTAISELGTTSDDISNAAKALKSTANVDVMDQQTGKMRDMQDILSDLSKKWDGLSRANQNYLAYAASGVRQTNIFEAIMKDYASATDLATKATNNSGAAAKANAVYLDSIQAKIKTFNSTVTTMWQNLISSDAVGNVVKTGTYLATNIVPVLKTIGGLILVFNGQSITSGIISSLGKVKDKFVDIKNTVANVFTGKGISEYTSALEELRNAQEASKVAQATLTLTQEQSKSAQAALTLAENSNTGSTEGNLTVKEAMKAVEIADINVKNAETAATEAETIATNAQKAASVGLSAAIGSVLGVIGLAVTAITLITMGVDSYNQAQEQALEEAKQAADTYKTESDSLNSLVSQYQTLGEKTNLTSEDKTTLKSIQDQLVGSYGDEAKAIDLVNGKYDDQIAKLNKLTKQKAQDFLDSNQKKLNDAKDTLDEKGSSYFSETNTPTYNALVKGTSAYTSQGEESGTLEVNGTLQQRINILKEILDKYDKISNKTQDEKDLISEVSEEYGALNKKLNASKSIVDQMNLAELRTKFSTQMNQMTDDAQKFAEAQKSGDTNAEKKATEDFQKLNKEVKNTKDLSPELKQAFADWANGLDAINTSTKSTPTGIDAVTSSLSSFDTQCKSIHTSITNLGTSLKDLDTAMAQVKEGTVLSGEEALNLVDKYGLSVDAIKSVAGGYTIEYSALEALRTAKIKATEQSIKDDISRAEQTLATARSALTAYGIEISGIQSLAQAKAELANIDNEKPPDMAGTSAEQQWENKKTAVKQVIDQYNTLATSQSKLDTLNKELSIVSQPNYTSAINKTTAAQKENTVAEKAAEKAAKAHVDALNAEKDALEKQKQALQDSSDQMSKDESAINSLLETTMAMLKQKYEDQKQALQDVIDKQSQANEATQKADDIALKSLQDKIKLEKDLLEQQKNEHEYQENLADKEKSVADIQAKLVSINPDNSDSNQKRKLDLQQQLSEKQKELTDFNYEHDYTVKSNAYDKEEARIEKLYADKKQMEDNDLQHIKDINEAKIKNIEKNSESEENIRKEALALINGKTNTFYNQLLAYNKKYGDSVDANVSTKWRSALDALSRYNGKQTDTLGTLNQLVTKMADYASKIKGVDGQIKGLETAISTAQKAVDGLKSSAGTAASSAVGSMNNAASAARKAEDNARRTSLQAQIANLITQKGKQNNYGAQNAIQSQIDALQFDLNHIPKYASGTLSSTGGLSILDELGLGSELIIHAPTQGRLVNMEKGGVVYDAAKSKNLDSFALNPQQYIANQLSQMKLPSFSNIQSSNSSNPYIDASVTINGNADNTAIAKIAQIQKELPQKIIDMIDNQRIGAGVKPNPKNM